jgi:hypothetical protein
MVQTMTTATVLGAIFVTLFLAALVDGGRPAPARVRRRQSGR